MARFAGRATEGELRRPPDPQHGVQVPPGAHHWISVNHGAEVLIADGACSLAAEVTPVDRQRCADTAMMFANQYARMGQADQGAIAEGSGISSPPPPHVFHS
jgi:hypothetical protein